MSKLHSRTLLEHHITFCSSCFNFSSFKAALTNRNDGRGEEKCSQTNFINAIRRQSDNTPDKFIVALEELSKLIEREDKHKVRNGKLYICRIVNNKSLWNEKLLIILYWCIERAVLSISGWEIVSSSLGKEKFRNVQKASTLSEQNIEL